MTSNEIAGMPCHKNGIKYPNSCPRNILTALLGIVILLIGMWITAAFTEGVVNSLINILVLDIAIAFVIKKTKIEMSLGVRVTLITILIVSIVVLLNIWLGAAVIYNNFLRGITSKLSGHYEHSLMYSEMSTIATRLKSGMSLNQAVLGLPLYQYYNIFVYSSFMFLVGGINVTNMCIWGAMHMILCPIFVVLMLGKYGIEDKRHLKMAYFVSLLQPMFLSVNTYNKVVIGEALVMTALYIFISAYNDPVKNLLCLPIYGYLLWTVRVQYLLIAGFLFVICLIHNKTSKKIVVPVAAAMIGITVFFARSGFDQLYQRLNFGRYYEGHDLSLRSIPARVIRSFLPYFPLSNIFTDQYWYFNMFCILQELMNITLWGLAFISRWKIDIHHAKTTLKNPLIWAAIALLLGGTFSELHTTYLSVGTMLLTSACENISGRKVAGVYFLVFMAVVLLTGLYVALGLQGMGLAGVRFS